MLNRGRPKTEDQTEDPRLTADAVSRAGKTEDRSPKTEVRRPKSCTNPYVLTPIKLD